MEITNPKVAHGKGVHIDDSNFVDFKKPINKYRTANLPHWEQDGVLMFITLRLSDSLPESKLEELIDYKLKYSDNPNNLEEIAERLRAIDNWLNKGHGSCILKYKPIQDVVDNTINFYDGNKYILFDYVIMSNHIHLLLIPIDPIRETMISFRRFTSRLINKITGKRGSIWQEDYFDRLIRNFKDFEETSDYIKTNPLGLKK